MATDTVVQSGGQQTVNASGSASSATISGRQDVSGGTASDTTVASGGQQHVHASGQATSTIVASGGTQNVSSSGLATDTVVQSGGQQHVHAAGQATSTVISTGGTQTIQASGTATSTVVQVGGQQTIREGGSATWTLVSGQQDVSGSASLTSVMSGGKQDIHSGGHATSTVVSSGGRQTIHIGGTASATVVQSNAQQHVSSGGTADGTTVQEGGTMTVDSGGRTSGHTLIQEGGLLQGSEWTNDGELELERHGSSSFGGDINGGGGITKSGTGTQSLAGTISQAKGFTVKEGTLDLNGGSYSADGHLVTLRGSGGQAQTVLLRNGARLNAGSGYVLADATRQGRVVFDTITAGATGKTLVEAVRGSHLDVDVIDSTLTGDIFYRDASTGLIQLTRSHLTGIIDPADMNIDAASIWTMTGDSLLNDLTLAGKIEFQAPVGTFVPKSLTVRSLAGQGGTVVLNQVLSDGSVQGDRLVVDGGKVTGNTMLDIRNHEGLGAQTVGDGLLVVEGKNGADTTASTTKDGFALKEPVYAGAYAYQLKAQSALGTGENWYLRSLPKAMYRPAAISIMSTMELTSLMTRDPLLRFTDRPGTGATGLHDLPRGWISAVYRGVDVEGRGDITPTFKASIAGVTGWADLWRQQNSRGAITRAGVYGALLEGQGRSRGDAGGVQGMATGQIRQTVSVAGVHLEHREPSGAYVKAAAQGSLNTGKITGADPLAVRGSGAAASLEVGKTFRLGETLTVEPQAQVIYQTQRFKRAELSGDTRVRMTTGDIVTSRLGAKFAWKPAGPASNTQVTVTTDLLHRGGGKHTAQFSKAGVPDTVLGAKFGGTSVGLGLGVQTQINKNWNVTGSVGYQRSIDGAKSQSVSGQIGVQFRF